MKVINLSQSSSIYTANVYFILGDYNTLADVNTLIDVGRDPVIIRKIFQTDSGVGKHRVQQVILTHNHYDHTSLLPLIKQKFNPRVYAFSANIKGVDRLLQDGDRVQIGDRMAEVIHTPGHTTDSICLYCPAEAALFTGDTHLFLEAPPANYSAAFITALRRLAGYKIDILYGGHGVSRKGDYGAKIRAALNHIRRENKRDA